MRCRVLIESAGWHVSHMHGPRRFRQSAGKMACRLWLLASVLFSPMLSADMLFGGKLAFMDLDAPAGDDPLNVALFAGYEFDSLIADLSLIGEVSRTAESGQSGNGDDVDFESESAYILWKTTRSLFVTLRGGLVKNKIIVGDGYRRGDGVLLGASVGIVIGRTRLQIEYTRLAGDADFIGIGMEI